MGDNFSAKLLLKFWIVITMCFTKACQLRSHFGGGGPSHSLCKLQVILNDQFESLPVVELIYFHSSSFQMLHLIQVMSV